ncbi:MAG: CYTH domain-containing protein [Deltaproteobacteria bacterium]|nr:CYTH domain-containing protein [Deltaproteobacteria bacterium]
MSENSSGREIELKLRVDDLGALMRIAQVAGGVPERTAHQTNSFFDTDDRALGMTGLVLRLREERVEATTRFFLTGKGPGTRDGSLTNVIEEEIEIDPAVAKALREGADPMAPLDVDPPSRRNIVAAMRRALAGRAPHIIGTFQNERVRLPTTLSVAGVDVAVVLELDRVAFPGGVVHHEVEMEVPTGVDPQAAADAFHALFGKAGVVGRVSPGKARRLFAALRRELAS